MRNHILHNEGLTPLAMVYDPSRVDKAKGCLMLLQIYFEVRDANVQAFEDMYRDVYIPAMQVQEGYLGSRLLKTFEPDGGAEQPQFNYQMILHFDTEENRVKWVDSDEHQVAFPKAQALSESWDAQKFDMAGKDGDA
jgi:antibiotic biosynthesis monooxygenase (ABM) superfamily enzyme